MAPSIELGSAVPVGDARSVTAQSTKGAQIQLPVRRRETLATEHGHESARQPEIGLKDAPPTPRCRCARR